MPRRVVFVCVGNSNRSRMAEAFARLDGGGRVEPSGAGSRPPGRVNPRAVEAMDELGYDLGRHRSKGLSQLPAGEYEYAVTMGCGDACPLVRARHREGWDVPDPKDLPPEQVRGRARPHRAEGQGPAGQAVTPPPGNAARGKPSRGGAAARLNRGATWPARSEGKKCTRRPPSRQY